MIICHSSVSPDFDGGGSVGVLRWNSDFRRGGQMREIGVSGFLRSLLSRPMLPDSKANSLRRPSLNYG